MANQKGHGTDEMDIAAEFIQHEQTKETQDYVARGRRFSHIAGPQLAEQWVVAFKRWFSDRPIKKLLVQMIWRLNYGCGGQSHRTRPSKWKPLKCAMR
jgi:hypothetical protein